MAERDYSDIIHLPHPVSSRHPSMPIGDRAAQFSPFAALTGHDAAIEETARLTDRRIELDEDTKSILNEKLLLLADCPHVEANFTYFQKDRHKAGGTYVTCAGQVKRVDGVDGRVVLKNGKVIPIPDIIDISLPHFLDQWED